MYQASGLYFLGPEISEIRLWTESIMAGRWEIMAEKKQSTQSEKNPDQVEKEKLESVKKADAAVKP